MKYTELFCFHLPIKENGLQNEKELKGIQKTVKDHLGNLNEFTSLGHARLYLRVLKDLVDTISQVPASDC